MITSEQEQNFLLSEAVDAAIHWARTGTGYFSMRDKVEAFLQANTPDNEHSLWFTHNSRKLAMHQLMSKCINPLSPAELSKLDHEIRDIAATLPENSVRHLRR